ncbi:MAG: oligosaccharide flippase family protein [Chloroflexia bacterium]|nr:oligosaccharide flippase family protein [Chloroflexia bacterium]
MNLFSSYLTGQQKFIRYAAFNISVQIFVTTFQVICLIYFEQLKYILIATLLPASFFNILITSWLFHKLKKQDEDKFKEKELTKYGINISLVNLIPSIASRLQYVILDSFSNPATLAIYAAAQLIPDKISVLFKSLLSPFSVHLVSLEKRRSIKIVKNGLLLFILLGLITTLFIALLIPVFIKMLFGDQYLDSIMFSLFLLVDILFTPINLFIANILVYHDQMKAFSKITVFRSIAMISLFIIFIPYFQIYGIIITRISIAIITAAIYIIWFSGLSAESNKTVLMMNKKDAPSEFFTIVITKKIEGLTILKIIEADYLSDKENYPMWVRLIAVLSFSKYINNETTRYNAKK